MGKIAILPDTLCNQIAAGEVVERPAAVVKELVENSIDAAAGRIQLNLLQGGRKEIRVVDDGIGMEPDDALLALERHATSKLRSSDDLQAIQSLGFRGEALPSIAAVSRFQLVTREAEALAAMRIEVDGGRIKDVREVGAPAGTTVTVRDLFFNLPARRKFLRSVETELAHINDQMIRLALAHPTIHLRMTHQGRVSHDYPRTDDSRQRLAQVFGERTGEVLKPVDGRNDPVRVHGMIGPPELQKANTKNLFIYVNERPVRDRTLNHVILSAYDTLLPKGRYPFVVLFVDLPPELVDVNVHPTKREVRFRRPHDVLTAVRAALADALEKMRDLGWNRPFFPGTDSVTTAPGQNIQEGRQLWAAPAPAGSPWPGRPTEQGPGTNARQSIAPADSRTGDETEQPRFSQLPITGQLINAYILLQAPDGLIFIDQHAAHERILFDQLAASAAAPGGSQRLSQPVVVDLLPLEAAALKRMLQPLAEIGFAIESFGGDSFVVHALPAPLDRIPPERLICDLLAASNLSDSTPKLEVLAAVAKTAACHRAVRAGQKLTPQEIQNLLQQLDQSRISSTCPHGRPLWWKLSYDEIERVFQRS